MTRPIIATLALLLMSSSALAASEVTTVVEDSSNEIILRDWVRLEDSGPYAAVVRDYLRSPFESFGDALIDSCGRGTCIRRMRAGGELAKLRQACTMMQRVGEVVYMGRNRGNYLYETSRNAEVVETRSPADHATYTFFDHDTALRAVCNYAAKLGRGRTTPDVTTSTYVSSVCVVRRAGTRSARSVTVTLRSGDYIVRNGDCSRD